MQTNKCKGICLLHFPLTINISFITSPPHLHRSNLAFFLLLHIRLNYLIPLHRLLIDHFLNKNQTSCDLNFNAISYCFTIINFFCKFCQFFLLVFLHNVFYFVLHLFYLFLHLNESWIIFNLGFLKDRHYFTTILTCFNDIVLSVSLKLIREIIKLSFGSEFFLWKFYVEVIKFSVELFEFVVFVKDICKVACENF